MTLDEVKLELGNCTRCKLHTTRKNIVFGEGNPNAELLFVGEAPGSTEDEKSRPFCGRSGNLLNKMIELIGLKREEVYIANIAKCRPTVDLKGVKDRPPDEEETIACSPFLIKQITAIRPKIVVTLGGPSSKFMINTSIGITALRGKWVNDPMGFKIMPTFHPAYLLRGMSNWKYAEQDMMTVRDELQKLKGS